MSKFLLVQAREGAEVLSSEYQDFLKSTGLRAEQLDRFVLDSATSRIPSVADYAGVFLGGSPFNVTDAQQSEVQLHVQREMLALAQSPIPTFYVCFGSSLLTQFCGGEVRAEFAEDAGATKVALTPAGQSDPLLRAVPQQFTALTGHTESVHELPEGSILLATGPACPVQMFRLHDSTWACQFHPEMDAAGLAARMRFYLNNGYFDPEKLEEIITSLASVDTTHAHQIMRNFVAMCAS
ncbi:glutamine amidotransferase [Corynebacterium sp. H127]|uniref:glutamine amidotransferase n=1 Tax=Corynebacterium sp. H127 TaxID=3133418 RepID=UPI0030978539